MQGKFLYFWVGRGRGRGWANGSNITTLRGGGSPEKIMMDYIGSKLFHGFLCSRCLFRMFQVFHLPDPSNLVLSLNRPRMSVCV